MHLGSGTEQGIVVGSHGTNNNPSLIPNTLDSIALATEDGAFFEHEPQGGTLTMAGVGTLHLSINGDSLIFSGGKWTLNVGGPVNINAGGTVTVTAPTVQVNGNVNISGNLSVSGSISGASENISGNTYSGSRTGGPI
jgi:phage baseplate assembly protein gpV